MDTLLNILIPALCVPGILAWFFVWCWALDSNEDESKNK